MKGKSKKHQLGKRVTLDNAIIIFTSNLYQATIKEIITKEKDPIAAEAAIRNLLSGDPTDALKYASRDLIYRETPTNSGVMTSKFPPEFIGRIDKVIPFTSLSVEDYKVGQFYLSFHHFLTVVNQVLPEYGEGELPLWSYCRVYGGLNVNGKPRFLRVS